MSLDPSAHSQLVVGNEALPDNQRVSSAVAVTRTCCGPIASHCCLLRTKLAHRYSEQMSQLGIDTVIFDVSGVILECDQRRALLGRWPEDQITAFLESADFQRINPLTDAGMSFSQAEELFAREAPQWAEIYADYWPHFAKIPGAPIPGSTELIQAVLDTGRRAYILSNWQAEAWHYAPLHAPILSTLPAVVSGQVGLIKPDPAIFRLACERFDCQPERTVMIDDLAENLAGARQIGLHTILFSSPAQVRRELVGLGVLG